MNWLKNVWKRFTSKQTAPKDLPSVYISPVPFESLVVQPTLIPEDKRKRKIRRSAKRTPKIKGSTDQT